MANFADLQRNNSVFMRKKKKITHLKKYNLQRKFLFQQLIKNFANFWQNNSELVQKIVHLKNIIHRENSYFGN